ncbi:MAG: cytochrome oxidase putative small subunit CydP [Burkholderiales bacterium]
MSERRTKPRLSPLGRDITLMLIIKAIALYLIWLAWFSGPQDINLDATQVGKNLITSTAAHKEANHAER